MAIETIAANKTGAPALEAAYAKITWHLLPFVSVLWIIAWIDRVNIGFAKLEMLDNLKFSEVAFGARRTIARFTIGWGVTSNLMMVVKTTTAFYALRFLLGAFEAGFYPGVILYITYWYPTSRRARPFGLFMSASAFAGVMPNYLHENWMDYPYWDSELEA